jgi:hypothetical protein
LVRQHNVESTFGNGIRDDPYNFVPVLSVSPEPQGVIITRGWGGFRSREMS